MLFIRSNEFFKLSRLNKNSFLHLYSKFAYNFVDNIHKNQYTKFKRRFEFRYLNKEQFDAYAHIKRFNLDSVYINYGSILLIHDLFYKLLSNPTAFPKHGKQNNELSEEILNFKPFIKNKTIYFQMPQDILRREIAQICSTIAVQFIILHEIGHHMNGHTLLQKKRKLSEKDRKTIEMDADSFAVTMSIQAAFLTSEHRMKYFSNLSLTNLDYIKLWIYIIHIVFYLFVMKRSTLNLIEISGDIYQEELEAYFPLKFLLNYFKDSSLIGSMISNLYLLK